MFPPSPLSTKTVAAPPPTPPCGYGKPSDVFRLLFLSGDAAAPPADSDCVHVWSHPLTGPVHSGFRDLLSEEECAAASPLPTPRSWRNGTGRPTAGCAPCCPAIWIPRPKRSGSAPVRTASPGLRTVRCTSTWRIRIRWPCSPCARDAPVGVDVEPVRHLPEAMLIACRWFSAPEIRWIAASDNRDRAFLRCWVCREAFLKATGEGLGRPLDSFALHPCGDTLRLDGAALAECTPLAGHVAAVACETLFPSC